jgi:hypothetical protein
MPDAQDYRVKSAEFTRLASAATSLKDMEGNSVNARKPSRTWPKTRNGWRQTETGLSRTERPPTDASVMGSQKTVLDPKATGRHASTRGCHDHNLSAGFPPPRGPTLGGTHDPNDRGCARLHGSIPNGRTATQRGPARKGSAQLVAGIRCHPRRKLIGSFRPLSRGIISLCRDLRLVVQNDAQQ